MIKRDCSTEEALHDRATHCQAGIQQKTAYSNKKPRRPINQVIEYGFSLLTADNCYKLREVVFPPQYGAEKGMGRCKSMPVLRVKLDFRLHKTIRLVELLRTLGKLRILGNA